MDITSNPASGPSRQYAPAVRAASDSVPPSAPKTAAATTEQTATSETASAAQAAPDIQSQYATAQRQAALSFKNVYAVSDQDFTIFKDATGQYITRYVSLRDGKVTYVPAPPTLVKPLQLDTGTTLPAHIAISA